MRDRFLREGSEVDDVALAVSAADGGVDLLALARLGRVYSSTVGSANGTTTSLVSCRQERERPKRHYKRQLRQNKNKHLFNARYSYLPSNVKKYTQHYAIITVVPESLAHLHRQEMPHIVPYFFYAPRVRR